ncbi:DUF4172 domain-containing protein [Vibrio natriegens]|uniref:DUF4172 domain-containing protein n=1 Tax=Vibrio natriegens TaxID=691 RepID=UPI00390BE2CA
MIRIEGVFESKESRNMWIWEQPSSPHFIWDDRFIEPLVRTTRFNLGILIGKMSCQTMVAVVPDISSWRRLSDPIISAFKSK